MLIIVLNTSRAQLDVAESKELPPYNHRSTGETKFENQHRAIPRWTRTSYKLVQLGLTSDSAVKDNALTAIATPCFPYVVSRHSKVFYYIYPHILTVIYLISKLLHTAQLSALILNTICRLSFLTGYQISLSRPSGIYRFKIIFQFLLLLPLTLVLNNLAQLALAS